jgi:pimeloyl-ACP methyl ester carboxylesterase
MSVPAALTRPRCVAARELSTPDGPLAALEATPDGAVRATALLVPGFTGSKEDFLPLLGRLAAEGVRVVAIDQRGQCESPGLQGRKRYSLARFGADLRALLPQLDDGTPLHLLGHSFGGYAVREALLGSPERVTPASVTMLGSGPTAVGGLSAARLRQFLVVSRFLSLRQINRIARMDQHDDPAVRAFLRGRWLGNDRASLRSIARQLLIEPDRTGQFAENLRRDSVPCLVVCGAEETTWPVEQQRTMAEQLGARFETIPQAGHSPNTEKPEELARVLLDFWLGSAARRSA